MENRFGVFGNVVRICRSVLKQTNTTTGIPRHNVNLVEPIVISERGHEAEVEPLVVLVVGLQNEAKVQRRGTVLQSEFHLGVASI